jgi:hypothetical protein
MLFLLFIPLYGFLPDRQKTADDRGYSTEEIQKMIEASPNYNNERDYYMDQVDQLKTRVNILEQEVSRLKRNNNNYNNRLY